MKTLKNVLIMSSLVLSGLSVNVFAGADPKIECETVDTTSACTCTSDGNAIASAICSLFHAGCVKEGDLYESKKTGAKICVK